MTFKFVNRAFVLVELLTAITLLSLLMLASYLLFPQMAMKARDARRKSDLHKIKIALEEYYDFASEFPESLPTCNQPLMYQQVKILSATPCDPVKKTPYYYQIKSSDDQQRYRLYTNLANVNDFSIVDVGCEGGCGPDCRYNYGVASTNANLIKCAYVCAPGGGREGSCELFQDATRSNCPITYGGDASCANACGESYNRCENASGKNVPD